MRSDWEKYGEWNDIPLLAIDSWNGYYNNKVHASLLGGFLPIIIIWTQGKKEHMYLSLSGEQEMAVLARNMFQKNPEVFHTLLNKYKVNRKKIMVRMEEIDKCDLKHISRNNLLALFQETRALIGITGAHDWFSFSFDRRMTEVVGLEEYFQRHPEQRDTLLSFVVPNAILPTLAEEIEILQLAIKVKGLSTEKIIEKYSPEIIPLSKKYGWIASLILYPLRTKEDYANVVYNASQKGNLKEELEDKESYLERVNTKYHQFIQKASLSVLIINAIEALRVLAELRAVAELDTLYCFTHARRLDAEIQKQLKLSPENYFSLYVEEVIFLLQGKKIEANFAHRKKMEGCYRDEEGRFRRIANTQSMFHSLEQNKVEGKELKGITGCPGKKKGKVRLINSSQDLHAFQEGDILVAKSTCVDYIVIMKKAGAIVTEYGGITSHAAIVSRELGIPSIIGVRGVTTMLKDGEMVEVDADKGIIRKIS